MTRYVINCDTDAIYHEICDRQKPHVNRKGEPIVRALPTMARRVARLLNADEKSQRARK